jgi:hypothetical protein
MRDSPYSDYRGNQWNDFFLQEPITTGKRTV